MHPLPTFRLSRPHSKFVHPLAGATFDNLKFQEGSASIRQNSVRQIVSTFRPIQPLKPPSDRVRALSDRLSRQLSFGCTRAANMRYSNTTQTTLKSDSLSPALQRQKPYEFPNIAVIVLGGLKSIKDIQERTLKKSLKSYFNVLFSLKGVITHQFVETVRPFLSSERLKLSKIDDKLKTEGFEQFEVSSLSNDLKRKLTKRDFLSKLKEIPKELREQFVNWHCIPSLELRESCLRDLILEICAQTYEKFNMAEGKSYVILNEKGEIVRDFVELQFTTKRLFFSEEDHSALQYKQFVNTLRGNALQLGRFSLRDTLKANFRVNIVPGKCDQTGVYVTQPISKSFRIYPRHPYERIERKRRMKSIQKAGEAEKSQAKVVVKQTLSEQMTREFNKLVEAYCYIDPKFKQDSGDRLPISELKKCIYFQDKTQQQFCRILQAAEISQHFTLADYIRVRNIINCTGGGIVNFVERYLQYDEYGQLKRRQLGSVLRLVLSRAGNSHQLIEQVIWSWLIRSKAVVNGVLRRDKMEECFQKNKIVYYLLISLIFGTNDTTALDLVHDIIV